MSTQEAASGATERARYHHGDLRQTLLNAACRQLARSSAENLSLRALAREAGVSQTAPYRHFKTKNSLFAAIATAGFEELLQVMRDSATSAGDSPAQRLNAIACGYVDWALDNPEKYKLCFDSVLVDFSQYRELQAAGDACYQLLTEEITRGVRQHVFIDQPVDALAVFLWSNVHGIASLLLARAEGKRPHSATGLLSSHSRQVIALGVSAILG